MISSIFLLQALSQETIEVPFKMGEHALVVDVMINDRKLSFMFDTGFSGDFVVDNNISLGKATGTMTLRDFVGEFEAETLKLKSVKLGGKAVKGDHEAVMQPGDYSFSYNTHCDGIMGFNVVKDEVMEINFQKSKFIFHPKSYDITKKIPDGQKTFLTKLLPTGNGSIPIEVVAPTGKRLILSLDTGNAFYATTHRDVLERVGLWAQDRKPKFMSSSFVASGAVDSWTKKLTDMTIFGVKVPTSYWDIIDLPSGSADSDGTVGFQFLKNFNLTIDFERRRVWMENYSGQVANEPTGTTGIIANYHVGSQRVRVYRVSPDSPALEAGIKVGDSILSIDGKELLGSLGYQEISEMLEGKVGSKIALSVSSGGEVKRVELERRALIND
ncbi:MAG: PDZ domain-containing protein [Fimbriimonadaceae bacterium]